MQNIIIELDLDKINKILYSNIVQYWRHKMNLAISYSEIRTHLKKNFDRVCSDHTPLLVTRKNGENVVVISEDDFQSLQETAYLCQSPKNLSRLLEALDRKEGHSLEKVKNELRI